MDRDIHGELFVSRLRHHLVPTLAPGDIVVMEILGPHKSAGVRETIEAAGPRLVYLPPYSPDLNSIALVFSTFTWPLQIASARNAGALWSVSGDVLDRFTEAQCRSCFRHCGHRHT